jgi:hypothetical protein
MERRDGTVGDSAIGRFQFFDTGVFGIGNERQIAFGMDSRSLNGGLER